MDESLDRLVESARIPAVNIGNLPRPRIPRVSSDNDAVGVLAAEYFLQRGFKHFAFYYRSGSLGERARGEAFQRRIREAGWKMHRLDWAAYSKPLEEHEKQSHLISWLSRQIAALPKPVAVFSEYDDFAVEILNACESNRTLVPEQLAVLGVGDDPLRCEFAPVPLSSVDDDEELIGYEAASLLGRMMKKERTGTDPILVPPRGITTRLSTDILAVEHPLVASALRTIWDHYTERIGAKQIAATVPMSYRRLHDAFIKHIGHSLADEITRKRLEHAQKLLEETDKKVIEIAWLSGFTDHDRMGKVFRRVLGVTPASYRRRFKSSVEDSPANS
jgi:LacI family transcriptional regulator